MGRTRVSGGGGHGCPGGVRVDAWGISPRIHWIKLDVWPPSALSRGEQRIQPVASNALRIRRHWRVEIPHSAASLPTEGQQTASGLFPQKSTSERRTSRSTGRSSGLRLIVAIRQAIRDRVRVDFEPWWRIASCMPIASSLGVGHSAAALPSGPRFFCSGGNILPNRHRGQSQGQGTVDAQICASQPSRPKNGFAGPLIRAFRGPVRYNPRPKTQGRTGAAGVTGPLKRGFRRYHILRRHGVSHFCLQPDPQGDRGRGAIPTLQPVSHWREKVLRQVCGSNRASAAPHFSFLRI
jgi:hypothetical protein